MANDDCSYNRQRATVVQLLRIPLVIFRFVPRGCTSDLFAYILACVSPFGQFVSIELVNKVLQI